MYERSFDHKSFNSPQSTGLVLFALVTITCLPVALIARLLVESPLRFVAVRLIAGLGPLVRRSRATAVPAVQAGASGPVAKAN
jgi:hypothetical protein